MNLPKQPTDFVPPSERTHPTRTNDLPPAWFGYLILGLFLLGTTLALSYGLSYAH